MGTGLEPERTRFFAPPGAPSYRKRSIVSLLQKHASPNASFLRAAAQADPVPEAVGAARPDSIARGSSGWSLRARLPMAARAVAAHPCGCVQWGLMTARQVYDEKVRPLSVAERLRVAAMILNDIPPQAVVDVGGEWSDDDLKEFAAAGWRQIGQRTEEGGDDPGR